jgi:hypothetical protein
MTPLLAPGIVALLVVWIVVSDRGRRRALLKRFRSEWGRVSTQERDFAAIALYHRTMQAGAKGDDLVSGTSYYKDERSWRLSGSAKTSGRSSSCLTHCSGVPARPNVSPRRTRC